VLDLGDLGRYRFIPGGTYRDGGLGDTHDVPDLYVKDTEVTVDEYAACVADGAACAPIPGAAPCNATVAGRELHPINCATWAEAVAYCSWAGGRLPDEWEWEWAARGRTEVRGYPWGGDAPTDVLTCWDRTTLEGSCSSDAHPAGASFDGLLGMAGNVLEWTASELAAGTRIVRGGSWFDTAANNLRVSARSGAVEVNRPASVGIRCVRTP
jgi:formylglycine-generating enzyme required for sulfatase activity